MGALSIFIAMRLGRGGVGRSILWGGWGTAIGHILWVIVVAVFNYGQ